MRGVITGKHAKNYDRQMFSRHDLRQPNRFLNRNVKPGKVLADLCCGGGVSIAYLKDRCRRIYGIDASKDMTTLCVKRFKDDRNIVIHTSDTTTTPLKSRSCDYVLIRMGLHHLSGEQKEAVIREAHRILKDRGELLIMDKFMLYNAFLTYTYDFFRSLRRRTGVFSHSFCTFPEFERMLSGRFIVAYAHMHPREAYLRANVVLRKCH